MITNFLQDDPELFEQWNNTFLTNDSYAEFKDVNVSALFVKILKI